MKVSPLFSRSRLSPAKALACGMLWALAMTATEGSTLPTANLNLAEFIGVGFYLVGRWLLPAAVLSGLGLWAGSRVSAVGAAALALLAAPFIALLWHGPEVLFFKYGQNPIARMIGVGDISDFDVVAYSTWRNAFYGAPFVAALVLLDKSAYARTLLGEARLSRQQAELAVGEAHVAIYRGQIQPEFLVGVAARLQELYPTNPSAADELMERMTDFLRAAVPTQRLGRSTLAAEIKIAIAYAALWNTFAPVGPVWSVVRSALPPPLAFSSLALVAVMERMTRVSPPDARLTLKAGSDGNGFFVSLTSSIGQTEWLSPALEQSVRNSLLAAQGTNFRLHQSFAAGGAALEITVRSAPLSFSDRVGASVSSLSVAAQRRP